jgi:uncharacterized protein (DUF1810 family)
MRLDNGARALEEVRVYLTVDEARRTVEMLNDLIEEVTTMGFDEVHGELADGELQLSLFVSKDAMVQASDFADRLEP